MKLTHATFGTGTVISEENGNITIDFNGTVKTLIVKFAKLTNEDGTAYGTAFVTPVKKQMSDKKRAEKLQITSAGSFDSCFNSIEERENWKLERIAKSRSTISY